MVFFNFFYRCVAAFFCIFICFFLLACGGGSGGGNSVTTLVADSTVTVTTVVTNTPTLSGWTLVWSDEFDGSGLPDTTKWDYDTSRNQLGWYNNELQYYSRARLDNSHIEDGKLIITARKERLAYVSDYGNQAYTSARMITRGKASWTYGFFEVRAKLPCGSGTWPAIWMLGSNGVWPDDGEIDIMEQTGQNKAEVLGTIHTRAYNFSNGTLGPGLGSKSTLADACTNFHNYQLTWTTDKIVVGVDNVNYFEYANPKNNSYSQWPFNNPQYLILNLAIGGDLGGAIPSSFTTQQMEVDYVRVYQK